MTPDLFDDLPAEHLPEIIAEGAVILRRFALDRAERLLGVIGEVTELAPLRRMKTPGGHAMSVAMSCCGEQGWVTDTRGYRYQSDDPLSGRPWPSMRDVFRTLAREAASAAGYEGFCPDACLINRYEPGAKMGLHQDRDEHDFKQPIVSVTLGLSQVFQFGGLRRNERPVNIPLHHGDVVVWGGPARLRYHGVLTLKAGDHPLTGPCRYNLTFRRAR
ncbi:alpha-ketoglutarate-dependent dioxygenase AlkB [Marinobacter salinus]|uniref:Alpha-ketoglutarate-dependent dioxygenase AlkB n=1 Tax=Marinobacter salinus TaxID=1874317 RepID=A0A1D9GL08_9GAMM|nr:DNA oxidative demethylase AlkB [Marinobacter salinus]AOY88323.1 alpha-ketoglutarate-dependent dioxygenase AlkB [Marinobacter salinus]